MSEIPAILRTQYDFSANELLAAFSDIRLGPFLQETQDWTDPNTDILWEATFDYFANLSGRRRRDGVDFAVKVRMDHKMIEQEDGAIREAYVKNQLVNAVLYLSTFRDCGCTVETPCGRHPR